MGLLPPLDHRPFYQHIRMEINREDGGEYPFLWPVGVLLVTALRSGSKTFCPTFGVSS
jgi:hypothetical protein